MLASTIQILEQARNKSMSGHQIQTEVHQDKVIKAGPWWMQSRQLIILTPIAWMCMRSKRGQRWGRWRSVLLALVLSHPKRGLYRRLSLCCILSFLGYNQLCYDVRLYWHYTVPPKTLKHNSLWYVKPQTKNTVESISMPSFFLQDITWMKTQWILTGRSGAVWP
jgi:hypothetical protein